MAGTSGRSDTQTPPLQAGHPVAGPLPTACASGGEAGSEGWVTRHVDALAASRRRGEALSASDLLARYPGLNDEAAIRLIYEEVCLRRESGEEVATVEVVSRFPRWREELELLLGCDRLMRPPVVAFPSAGERLGDFLLFAELGRGTAGRTYLAAQPALADRPVILKVTSGDHDEHLSLARLQHTHIVPLYSEQVFPERGLRALCMPYLGGGNCAQILSVLASVPAERRRGADILEALDRLQPEGRRAIAAAGPFRRYLEKASYVHSICWVAACLADALQYAHDRGLVHMDVKPSNVLIAADGQPLLLDFHLARGPIVPGCRLPDRLGGTPGWMSPEQRTAMRAVAEGCEVDEAVDGRSDLFALGLLMYEALGGPGGTAEMLVRPRLDRCNPRVSVGLADIVHGCLAADPASRYPTAGALAEDLRRHLSDLPLRHVRNRSLAERLRKWRSRHPQALAKATARLTVLTALVVVGGLSWAFGHQRLNQVEDLLADARRLQGEHRYAEAFRIAERGLALAERTPGSGGLARDLSKQRQRSQRGRKADELHTLVELIRFRFGVAPAVSGEARRLAALCERIWKERSVLLGGAQQAPLDTATEHRIALDLRELALVWADLHTRLADPPDAAAARRESLCVLDEARASFGASPALAFERLAQRRALGLDPEPAAGSLLAAAPRTAWEHNELGRALVRAGRFAEGAAEFAHTLEERPGDFWANFYQGLCAYRMGQFPEALAAFRVCVSLAPNQPECHYNRALAAASAGLASDALRGYTRAIELDPELTGAWLNRGILAYKAGRPRDAIADFERALHTSAGADISAQIRNNLALAHGALGEGSEPLAARRNAPAPGQAASPAKQEAPSYEP